MLIQNKKDYNSFNAIFYNHYWLLKEYKIIIYNLNRNQFYEDTKTAVSRWVNMGNNVRVAE